MFIKVEYIEGFISVYCSLKYLGLLFTPALDSLIYTLVLFLDTLWIFFTFYCSDFTIFIKREFKYLAKLQKSIQRSSYLVTKKYLSLSNIIRNKKNDF